MSFSRFGDGWRVLFKEDLNAWPMSRVLTFRDADKLRDLYQRFASNRMSEDRQAFEFGLQQGCGMVELILGREQYQVLQGTKMPSQSTA